MTDAFDVDAWLNDAKPSVAKARVCVQGDLLDQHAELDALFAREKLADSKRNKGHKAPAIADRLEELEAEIEASMRTFTFHGIGRRAWNKLKAAHPKLDDDGKPEVDFDHHTGRFVDFNAETFPIAAIAASSASPKVSQEQAERLDAELNDAQFAELWSAVVQANLGVVVEAPKSVLAFADRALRSAVASTTSSPEESPPASETADSEGLSTSTSTTTPDD